MATLKLPTVDNFLNYFPLPIGGYIIGGVNLVGNIFASVLQLRRTISLNLKEFNGESDAEFVCKNSYFYSYNELMSSNTVLSAFISFYLITGISSNDGTKILPFLLYVGTYTLTSLVHMMSVQEGHVAFGFFLLAFHGYSFIVIYSILSKILAGGDDDEKKGEEESEKLDADDETSKEKPANDEKVSGDDDEIVSVKVDDDGKISINSIFKSNFIS